MYHIGGGWILSPFRKKKTHVETKCLCTYVHTIINLEGNKNWKQRLRHL